MSPGTALAHTLLAADETRAAAGGGERKVAEFLVKSVMRWELGFEKGRRHAGPTAGRRGPRRRLGLGRVCKRLIFRG